jgi:hypothetical protein
LNKKIINSHMAVSSMIIILLIVCSTQFAGMAGGQQSQQQAPPAGGTTESPVIQGLEGLKGFGSGHNQLSLAIIPLSQQNNQMTFQVIGFAVSSPESGQAVVYSLETPLPGIIDPSQYTMQIDISNIATAVDTSGYIDSSEIYDTIRTDPQVVVIDLDLYYQGKQDSRTIFNVNSIDIIPPDGRMQTYSMQQPTQLIIDTQSNRVAMVAFPQMASTFNSYYGATYTQVEPVVYAQPVPIVAPVFVPYIRPIPFYTRGFVPFNPFYFGSGFRPFYQRNRYTNIDIYSNRNSFPIRETRNDFADRARNDLVTGQRRGEFTQHRNVGKSISGGIGGYRGGARISTGAKVGGIRAGGGGGRRR